MLRISHAKDVSKSRCFVDGFTPLNVIGGKGGSSGMEDVGVIDADGEVGLRRLKTFSKSDGRR